MTLANRGKTVQQDGKTRTVASTNSFSTLTKEEITSYIARNYLGYNIDYVKDAVAIEFVGQGMTENEIKDIVQEFMTM
jgi:hypothetical protein